MSSVFEPEVVEVMDFSKADRSTETQLSAEEKREIDAEFSHYEDKASVGLEALRIVQKHRGWISDQSLQAVSDYLDIPSAQLEGVATFFQLIFRQPVGKEVILFCKSASCWIMGCARLQARIEQKLQIAPGQTSGDGIFTLLETPCLGDCDKAPVMMVGEEMHRNLTEQSIDEIIDNKKRRHADESTD
ncbi:NADH-quinone oxidoreductase subunit NuoE [Microbulbifer rhizosphaerae]|uniref:NADH-quinone oxidoreductase subunit E n=1 Tax=Microbulbifer rhizosphaerae TaxID=1562603 RepID=A0A7W4ZAW8_9GAMM|nr:NADH-quinone oxidoreductase subunit NuoE [Microbulbifer rhizosphaerae]MBB3062996.1 NADH-quinone oxidoreductase subunit E [Microbulbifer rhizosphaerae]